jgi:hypothetical protein
MRIPEPCGPLTEALHEQLPSPRRELATPAIDPSLDPLTDRDTQLALFICHELHFGGFSEVSDTWEWQPSLIGFRNALEQAMIERLLDQLGAPRSLPPKAVPETIFELVRNDDGPPLARFIETQASLEQFREFVMQRSAYQLKEADPHTFAIPRITGPAKAAMVEVQADEYGGGDPERMHSRLFANTMEALGLDSAYGAYVPRLPATTLATVNLISLFSLRRRWRGALVGHLAGFEISSAEPNRRYANGLRRLGLEGTVVEFYDEHVEADSVHENIAAYDLAGGLAAQEPQLAGDIVFGLRALLFCESMFAGQILDAWRRGESSLLSAASRPVTV